MNEELKDAMECWRNSGGFHANDPSECFETVYLLAAAFMDQQDDALADGPWLKSIGAVRPMAVAAETVYVLGEWKVNEHGGAGTYPIELTWDARRGAVDAKRAFIVRVFGVIVFMRPTRGDIRRLAAALGVALKATT